MPTSFGVLVQRLPRRRDRVLAIAQFVGSRSRQPYVRPVAVRKMFEALRIPEPGNISEELARLGREELMRPGPDRTWSVTPLGREAVTTLIGDLDEAEVEAELRTQGVALFDHVEHPLIGPELAPLRFRPAIDRILAVSPFESNVFLMRRFPPAGAGPEHPIAAAIEIARSTLSERGLTLHLASDRQADDQVLGNVGAHLWASKYGIALLDASDERYPGQLNDNVLIEVGAMLVTGRRCALLKDSSAPPLPSDFVAEIYTEVELADTSTVAEAVAAWVGADLGL